MILVLTMNTHVQFLLSSCEIDNIDDVDQWIKM